MKYNKNCFIIPSLQAGGMERVMSELIWYYSSMKELELHLILYGIKREIFFQVPDSVHLHQPSFKFNNRLRLFSTLKTLFFLRKKVNAIHPDSILSFGELWNSFVLLALYGLKFPVYISDRCSPERRYNTLHLFLRKWLYPRATGIIAQTQKAKEIYFNLFRHNNIEIIGNPIQEIKLDRNIRRENIILMVGRLIETKHQDELVKMFLKINNPGWKLVLVGYDHLQQNNSERIREIIDSHNAQERVFLEGKQTDVARYYAKSKIFAFTSSSEGFPNAIGEAMSAGIPAVAFDCVAGPSEMINDNYNGFLVPLFDFKKFREKLELLMQDEDLRIKMGERAKVDIKKYSIQRVSDRFLSFITQNQDLLNT